MSVSASKKKEQSRNFINHSQSVIVDEDDLLCDVDSGDEDTMSKLGIQREAFIQDRNRSDLHSLSKHKFTRSSTDSMQPYIEHMA